MAAVFQDVRYGLRMLAKSPGFTLVGVLALGLGIGATTAIFSIANATLIRPLPYSDSGRLVMVWGNFVKLNMTRMGVSVPEFNDYKSQTDLFSDVAAFQHVNFNLTGTDEPERIGGERVSASLFPLLGTPAEKGRWIAADEDKQGHEPVAVISHGLWKRRFGGDAAVVGKSITLEGKSYTIVGVMPQEFQFPFGEPYDPQRAEVWVPASFTTEELGDRGRYSFLMIGRLKSGVSLARAQVEMNTIGARFVDQYPRTYRGPKGEDGGWGVTVTALNDEIVGNARLFIFVLLGVVGFLLLIACANVTNLALARASARQKEISIRGALGASRIRLVRQFLTESVLLSLLGGTFGLLLAMWGVDLLIKAFPAEIPRLTEASLDWRVLVFTFGVSLLTGLLFGLAPALRGSRADLNDALKGTGANATAGFRRQRLRSLLVISELALALVLLIGAGLLIKSFRRLLDVDPGFNPDNVATMQLAAPASGAETATFYDQLLERVKALPQTDSASLTTALPLTGATYGGPFSIGGRPLDMSGPPPHVYFRTTGPGYFHVMGIPIIKGRDFNGDDTDRSEPVVIVNEALARGFFSEGDAIGNRLKLGAPQNPRPWMTITGVVKDVRSDGLDTAVTPEMYVPYSQTTGPNATSGAMTLVVRSNVDAAGSIATIRREVQAFAKDQPVYNITTMKQLLRQSVAQRRFRMLMLIVFAAVALLLAASGVFGVMGYTVAQRTREIGIRMSLGAERRDILKMVGQDGLILISIGVALGLSAALVLTRVISGLLFGVGPLDPPTFTLVSALVAFVSLLACYIPARRATRVDPITALSYE